MTQCTRERWTKADTEKLIKAWPNDNLSILDIATMLKRSEPEVRARVSNLRSQSPALRKKLPVRTPPNKLTVAMVRRMRKDTRTLKEIGKEYKVSPVTVFRIKRGESWKNA